MSLLRLLAVACLTALVAAAVAPAAEAPGSARAQGHAALLPGGAQGGAAASTGAAAERVARVSGLRPTGGGRIGRVEVRVAVSGDGARSRAEGTVEGADLRLLDGRVRVSAFRMSARVEADPSGAGGALEAADIAGLVVDGRHVDAGQGTRVEIAGVGTLVVLEHLDDGAGGLSANALRLEVSDPAASRLVGQPFVVGHLELSARAGRSAPPDPGPDPPPSTAPSRTGPAPPPATRPAPRAPRRQAPAPRTAPRPRSSPAPAPAPPRRAAPLPPTAPLPPALGLPRRPAPAVPLPQGPGYVFPVFGDVSFVDDYGAPRAGTGWHQGNDIFAPTGTPVLAVADGSLSRVGVNTLGGNRLWLTDGDGVQYYYAHLSAFAPAAVEGARVRAGQVIGFVGNTGQAITTPPHLHFEIRPGGRDSVNPYPYLLAWERGASTLPRAFRQAAASPSAAPAAGAVLVGSTPEVDSGPGPEDGLAVPAG